MRRLARVLCVVVLGTAGSAAGLPTASAAEGGFLRLAHLSPDTPAVDVYVDSVSDPDAGVVLEGVGYGVVSDYQAVPPGSYTVAMRTAGAAADTPAVLSTTVQVDAGSARTVAGVGYFADLGLEVLEDDLTLPAPGSARVRVVAAAAGAGALDVSLADGPPLASALAFASASDYVEVPGGAATLRVTPEGGQATDLPLEVAAGSVHTVLVLDRSGGGLTVQPLLDAASMGAVPVGGVATGAGGLSGGSGHHVPLGVGIALLAAACLLVGRRDRPARRRSSAAS
jgi:hypothetical protein